jgi:hypothetical protein
MTFDYVSNYTSLNSAAGSCKLENLTGSPFGGLNGQS